MTAQDITNHLIALSVDGKFNGHRMAKRDIIKSIRKLDPGESVLWSIALPDGTWMVRVDRLRLVGCNYDYWLPTDRDEEQKMMGVSVTRQHPDQTCPLANRHVNLAPTL
jgi:hypothetical protein